MAGVGKLLKQAQKMQKRMEALQAELAERELEVSAAGGAVRITVNGQSEFRKLSIDPEFLREDAEMVEETLLEAIRDAARQAKELNEREMEKISQGMQFPGLM